MGTHHLNDREDYYNISGLTEPTSKPTFDELCLELLAEQECNLMLRAEIVALKEEILELRRVLCQWNSST